jgi:hypothetical protein
MGYTDDSNVIMIDMFYSAFFRVELPDWTWAARALHDALPVDVVNSKAELSLELRQRVAFAHFGL